MQSLYTQIAALGGSLLVLPLMLPVAGLLLALALGGRWARGLALTLLWLGLAVALAIAAILLQGGEPLSYTLGGWAPPLGVTLKADGLSAVLLLLSPLVLLAVGHSARRGFQVPDRGDETRRSLAFWVLLLGVWAGLNTLSLAQDLFTLFVALELLTFSAVPLVALDGRPETLQAALRYLLFALLGSVLYLLGAVLFYGSYGTLDIPLLAERIGSADALPPAVALAAALMTTGLMAKTALLPLHLWLPPAHAGAPAPASAVLSALVVKGSFFLVLRLWFDVIPGLPGLPAATVLGVLGACAILLGNLVALGQVRLKLLVAYSTVAQIGYLFLIFPLASGAGQGPALTAGTLQIVSHACAKAAMFLAAGIIAYALGHDRVRDLGGVARALPVTVLGFALAGLSLVGLQPSGGYLVKALLETAADLTGQGTWSLVPLAGGLLTAAYLARVLASALSGPRPTLIQGPSRPQEGLVLILALASLLLGLLPPELFGLIGVGRTGVDTGGLDTAALVAGALASAWTWDSLVGTLAPLLGVVALVLLLKRRGLSAAALVVSRTDAALRQWAIAGLSLLALTLGLAAGIALGR
jgi:formate hydrogenlyase subunit 3/multisubunit Na+/H+ antiporter MnhD subunit